MEGNGGTPNDFTTDACSYYKGAWKDKVGTPLSIELPKSLNPSVAIDSTDPRKEELKNSGDQLIKSAGRASRTTRHRRRVAMGGGMPLSAIIQVATKPTSDVAVEIAFDAAVQAADQAANSGQPPSRQSRNDTVSNILTTRAGVTKTPAKDQETPQSLSSPGNGQGTAGTTMPTPRGRKSPSTTRHAQGRTGAVLPAKRPEVEDTSSLLGSEESSFAKKPRTAARETAAPSVRVPSAKTSEQAKREEAAQSIPKLAEEEDSKAGDGN